LKKKYPNGSISFQHEITKIQKFKLNKLNPNFDSFILDGVLGKDLHIFLTNNPVSVNNWTYERFIKKFKENLPDRDIWVWSGFTWEEILEDENRFSLIKECDILIDGKYMDNLKDLNLKWRGSSNQRVIDIKKSLEKNEVIEYI